MRPSFLASIWTGVAIALLTASHSFGGQKIDSFAGVYKTDGGPRPGELSRIENILEIVKEDESSLYFRLHAESPQNGCICGLWGIAKAKNGHFEYRESSEGTCKISFALSSSVVSISYEGDCGCNHCPAGMIEKFPTAKRRPIKYLDRIKKSRQYLEAIKAR